MFQKVASFHGCVHVVHKHSPPAHLRSWPLTVIRLVLPPKGELGNNKQNWGIATNNKAAQKRLEKIMGETPQGIAIQTKHLNLRKKVLKGSLLKSVGVSLKQDQLKMS